MVRGWRVRSRSRYCGAHYTSSWLDYEDLVKHVKACWHQQEGPWEAMPVGIGQDYQPIGLPLPDGRIAAGPGLIRMVHDLHYTWDLEAAERGVARLSGYAGKIYVTGTWYRVTRGLPRGPWTAVEEIGLGLPIRKPVKGFYTSGPRRGEPWDAPEEARYLECPEIIRSAP